MASERIPLIFEQIDEHNTQLKHWVALLVMGAIIADERIADEEIPYLEQLKDQVKNLPETIQMIESLSESLAMPDLASYEIDMDLADDIFECLYEICGSDFEFHPAEFDYLYRASTALGIMYPKL